MATVRMKKGNKFADIYDSPETIKQAQLEGYSLVKEERHAPKTSELFTEKPEEKDEEKPAEPVQGETAGAVETNGSRRGGRGSGK